MPAINVAALTQRTLQGEQDWWYASTDLTGGVATVTKEGLVELWVASEQSALTIRGFMTLHGSNGATESFAPPLPLVLAAYRIAADPSSQHRRVKLTEATVREIVRDEMCRALAATRYCKGDQPCT